jgi:broad specificity phosphatase PhoE
VWQWRSVDSSGNAASLASGSQARDIPTEAVSTVPTRLPSLASRLPHADPIQAEQSCTNRDDVEYSDVIIFSHGHFSRVFIARWCGFPLSAGYNFQADAGGVNILGYQHMSLEEPCECTRRRVRCAHSG